jgi:hypothetical protein
MGDNAMKGMRLAVTILLAFLGVGAVVGAVPMILWPFETQWNLLPVSVLDYSPFHFSIPWDHSSAFEWPVGVVGALAGDRA